MISNVFAVFDTKVGAFMQPFFSNNQQTAMRAFTDAAMDPSTTLSKHPEDYHLYHLGSFNDETGELSSIRPVSLCTAAGVIIKEQ